MRIRANSPVVRGGAGCGCSKSAGDSRVRPAKRGQNHDPRITQETHFSYKRVSSEDSSLSVKCVSMSAAERNEVELALNAIGRLLNGTATNGAFPASATPNSTVGAEDTFCAENRCNGLRWGGYTQGSPAGIVRAYLEFGKIRLKKKKTGKGKCVSDPDEYGKAYVKCRTQMRPPNRTTTVYLCAASLELALQGGGLQTRKLADIICHELYHLAGADEHAAFSMQPFEPDTSMAQCNF